MSRQIHIAAIQLSISDREAKEDRIQHVQNLLSGLADASVRPDLVLLPELWPCGFFDFDHYYSSAEAPDGPVASMLSEMASRLQTNLLGGSLILKENGHYTNTSLLFDRNGRLAASYRKLHLFGFESKEKQLLTPGDRIVLADTDIGRIGLSTCYDLRFPELYRRMAGLGAELFAIVSDWPMARLNHWRLFHQVRALENQCFLVSCNCAGSQLGTVNAGHSMAVDPFGMILAEANEQECILQYSVDLEDIGRSRRSFPALADRRSDLF